MKLNMAKIVLPLCVVVLLFACTQTYTKEDIEKLFEPISSKYGINIVYEIGKGFLSPVETIGPPPGPAKDSKVKRIDNAILARYPSLLQQAMERYPDQVVKNNLKAIHFAGMIEDGIKIAGSYDPYRKVIYLVNDGTQSDDYSKGVIHHEFSSVLLKAYGFLLNPWLEQNPADFKYLYDLHGSLGNIQKNTKLTTNGTPIDYENGFMNSYGQTNFENDFNEYSAMIFTHPQKFKKIMNQYPRVREKFLVWLSFYHEIDPVFTETYFFGAS